MKKFMNLSAKAKKVLFTSVITVLFLFYYGTAYNLFADNCSYDGCFYGENWQDCTTRNNGPQCILVKPWPHPFQHICSECLVIE